MNVRLAAGLVPLDKVRQQRPSSHMTVEVTQGSGLCRQSTFDEEVRERILVRVVNRADIRTLDEVVPSDDLNPLRMSDIDRVHPQVAHALVSAVLEITSRIGAPKLEGNRGHIELPSAVKNVGVGFAAGKLVERSARARHTRDP